MDTVALMAITLAIVSYGLVSARAQRSFVTPAMAFVVFGYAIGPGALGWLRGESEGSAIHALAELTLVVVLFTDASRIKFRLLRRDHNLPVRLLLVGLPLTIAAGTVVALGCFPEFSVWHAAVLATIVAPTDASLAHPVVTNSLVPVRIRQTISVESGLNDGICVPLVLLFLCGARSTGHGADPAYWIQFAAMQITLGPLVGTGVGYVGGRLLKTATEREWTGTSFVDLAALALAGVAYSVAELVGGNGFIAAFCGGLAMGHIAPDVCRRVHEFGESEGQLLTLLIFLAVGALIIPQIATEITLPAVLFSVLSLTALRMVPVAISLLGAGLQSRSVAFVGWFGPRGTASVVFALMLLQDSRVSFRHEIFTVVMTTVLISVFAHGLSAVPLARWYGGRTRGMAMRTDSPEHQQVEELPFCCRMSAELAADQKVRRT